MRAKRGGRRAVSDARCWGRGLGAGEGGGVRRAVLGTRARRGGRRRCQTRGVGDGG
ncbi:MAG: hypothetical protein LBK25_08395 [Treponema sp.]|nr:hypothetical protein [Treponema sp.]